MEEPENHVLVFRIDPDPVVFHAVHHFVPLLVSRDSNDPGSGGIKILQCIIQQIGEDLADLGCVSAARGQGIHLYRRACLLDRELRRLDDLGHHLVQVQWFDRQGGDADSRNVQ